MGKKLFKIIASTATLCIVLNSNLVYAKENVLTNKKLQGKTRIETAIKIAEESLNNTWQGSKSIILTSSKNENLVDALTVSPLAYELKAPILLNDMKDTVNPDTLKVLKDKKIEKVYIATGKGVISDKIFKDLESIGIKKENIIRLGGENRHKTNTNILNEFKKDGGKFEKVTLVSDNSISDALSIASIAAVKGMPIILTSGKHNIPKQFHNIIDNAKKVYAVGGNGVIADGLVKQTRAVRLGGKDRYETNARVIDKFANDCLKFEKVYLANGENSHLVDSLTGSILASQTNSPIVLGNENVEKNTDLVEVLKKNLKSNTELIQLGGVVSQNFSNFIEKLKPKKKLDEKPIKTLPKKEENNKKEEKPVETKLEITSIESYKGTDNMVVVNFNKAITKEEQNKIVEGNRIVIRKANQQLQNAVSAFSNDTNNINFSEDGKSVTIYLKNAVVEDENYIVSILNNDYSKLNIAKSIVDSKPTQLCKEDGKIKINRALKQDQFIIKYPKKMNEDDILNVNNYWVQDVNTGKIMSGNNLIENPDCIQILNDDDIDEVKIKFKSNILNSAHKYMLGVKSRSINNKKLIYENSYTQLPVKSMIEAQPIAKSINIVDSNTINIVYDQDIENIKNKDLSNKVTIYGCTKVIDKVVGNTISPSVLQLKIISKNNDGNIFLRNNKYNIKLEQNLIKNSFYANSFSKDLYKEKIEINDNVKKIEVVSANFIQNDYDKNNVDLILTFNQQVQVPKKDKFSENTTIEISEDTTKSIIDATKLKEDSIEIYDKDVYGYSLVIKNINKICKDFYKDSGVDFTEMDKTKVYNIIIKRNLINAYNFDNSKNENDVTPDEVKGIDLP